MAKNTTKFDSTTNKSLEEPQLFSSKSIGTFQQCLQYALIGGLIVPIVAYQTGEFHIGQSILIIFILALLGAYWNLLRYAGIGEPPLFSLKWIIARTALPVWILGVMIGSYFVIPAGPGQFELVQVVWISIICISIPGGLLALALEYAANVGKYKYDLEG